MKIERLYAITVYLLNHGRTSAAELAKYFEVSVRTIQRDIDSLCLSGIPIVSVTGAAGGYEISAQFRLDKHPATSNDYSYILTALKGLVSATNDINAKIKAAIVSYLDDKKPNIMALGYTKQDATINASKLNAAVQNAIDTDGGGYSSFVLKNSADEVINEDILDIGCLAYLEKLKINSVDIVL